MNNSENPLDAPIAVCVLFHERVDATVKCIRSFSNSPARIYVLDNGSLTSSNRELMARIEDLDRVKILRSHNNLGVSGGRNFLIRSTSEPWLLFVDNDISVITGDWYKRMLRHMSSSNRIDALIPRLFQIHEGMYAKFCSVRVVGDRAMHVPVYRDGVANSFPGGAAIVNRTLFNRIGLYDEEMFVGLEDFELAIRAIRLGEPIMARFVQDILLEHSHDKALQSPDADAAETRYDSKEIQKSYTHIQRKHNVMYDLSWLEWTLRERSRIAGTNSQSDTKDTVPDFVSTIRSNLNSLYRRVASLGSPISCKVFLKCPPLEDDNSVSGRTSNKGECTSVRTIDEAIRLYPLINVFRIVEPSEPSHSPDFRDSIDWLLSRGYFVGISSYGHQADDILRLKYAPNFITFELGGTHIGNAPTNDVQSISNQAVKAYQMIRNHFGNAGFSYNLNASNYRNIEKVVSICDDLKPEYLSLSNYIPPWEYHDDADGRPIRRSDKEVIRFINEVCEHKSYVRTKPIYLSDEPRLCHCTSYNVLMTLDSLGNIGGCEYRIEPGSDFGNIFHGNDPYNTNEMRKRRDCQIHSQCAHAECLLCYAKERQ